MSGTIAVKPSAFFASLKVIEIREKLLVGKKADELSSKRAAVAALYESHFERVARYIAARIGSISDAENIASEVFIKALNAADSFKDTGAPMEAWIFKIAHNLTVNHLRDRSRRPVSVPIDEALEISDPNLPADSAERKETIENVRRAVQQLSEGQRQVIALRFGSDMISEQVAAVMGKNPGAVREMQSAAIKRLRQILEQQK